ncbi:alkaline phosphatase family protein [Sphingobacterium sp. UT-1RO-CII-1]|uniref:alkaline phosphatase family protein n=1 Tax=Sphingobacterium sp. UT-1RO-CII-1 TaxID=2995225 RepID=UPI00227B5AA0|nr:nucleotide pyrophosphatase/phosphodiesterase family protein [Sphingobacterium sp. UT-1RO-CII-1]MCY4778350.1 alkaline phosphatase family protein [Sphingobacterium sp. UT-1RO-CII-1]
MKRIVVIDVVGLSASVIGQYTPFLEKFIQKNKLNKIKPVLPALTTSAQTTYLTGAYPAKHGIVGNGWYDHTDSEIKFWKQSNKLVQAENIWTTAKKINNQFTCAQMFWWYNMYNDVDFSATPRPNYLADGRKIPDFYSYPNSLRDELIEKLGAFPLFNFWGPNAGIVSSEWIANAAMYVEEKHSPTLNLIYLPQLDYCLQKFGPDQEKIKKELSEIDNLLEKLVGYFESRSVEVVLLSEYGIAPVNKPVHLNRVLRKEGLLAIRVERGLELLDAGASDAFSVSDHQVAHIYCKTEEIKQRVKKIIEKIPGVNKVLDREEQKAYQVDHERTGDLLVLADRDAWFTYYFWLDDNKAPDYARMVDIHKKPGYDPVEMFMTSKSRAIYKLLLKKIGFRAVLDITPLDANLVKGSHGIVDVDEAYYPILIGKDDFEGFVDPTSVKQYLLDKIFE